VSRIGFLVLLAACSGYQTSREAQEAEQRGNWDQAVLAYLELVDQDPDNVRYRQGLLRAKMKASQMHFERAKDLHEAGALNRALQEYRQATQLDPSNQYAQVELEKVAQQIAAEERSGGPIPTIAEMREATKGARAQPPVLNPRSNEPISLSFPRPVSVQDIYQALGKAFGINVLFDPKLRDQEITIELEQVVARDALEILMRSAKHFYKVLDEHSIIVVEDNPQNRRAYEDLVIQTFFLSNAETKDVMTMLRSLIGSKNIASNEQLNAIVLRDTADKVKVAESIINVNDKSRGELVVDVELLEIDTGRMQELGVLLSDYSVTQFLDPALQVDDTGGFRVSDLEFINQADWLVTIPNIIYDFMKATSEVQILASPQVRISDGEKALVHIGEQVPIPVTTFNSANTIGGNIVPITSFQYQDVGIRLDIEPRIHHNKEITLKLKVEVSAVSGTVVSGLSEQPIIATRRIESTIRLMDGETNFLAGLIRSDETVQDVGVAGLSDIPVIGRLFTHRATDVSRTDLILTLTPHIIRIPNVEEQDLLPIWVGTEANITFRGGSPRVESEVDGPFDEDQEDEDASRIRDMIRRRIQNLPRGLEDSEEQGEPDETAPGSDLAAPGQPDDFFGGPADEEDDQDDGGSPMASQLPLSQPMIVPVGLEPKSGYPDSRFVSAANQSKAARVRLVPSKKRLTVGERFGVAIAVEAATPVSHFPITLKYDPEALRVLDVEAGDFLGDRSSSEVMVNFSRPGRIVIGASRLGSRSGVAGQGSIALIELEALQEGRAVVKFEKCKVLDRKLRPVKPLARRKAVVFVGSEGSSSSPEQIEDEDHLQDGAAPTSQSDVVVET
jgi:general secretion pathway protein D